MALQEVLTQFKLQFDQGKLAAIEQGVGRTKQQLSGAAQNMAAYQQSLGGWLGRAGQMVGAYLGYSAIKSLTTGYSNLADAAAKTALSLNMSTREYQGLSYAAGLGGANQEQATIAFTKVAKNAYEASRGNKELAKTFEQLGVKVKNQDGTLKSVDALIYEMADGMVALPDKGKAAGIAMTIMGKSGAKMVPTLLEGAAGLKTLVEQAEKGGGIISPKRLKEAENYQDAMTRLSTVIKGLRNNIAMQIIPAITRMTERFTKWFREGDNATKVMRWLRVAAMAVGVVVGKMITGVVIAQVAAFVAGVRAAVAMVRGLGLAASLAAIKVWLIFAAFAAVFLIIDDLVAFAQGRDSMIGRLLGDSDIAKNLKTSLLDLAAAAKAAWTEIKPALLEVWEELKPLIKQVWEAIKPLIGPAFKAGIYLLIHAIGKLAFTLRLVSAGISGVSDAINWVWNNVERLINALLKVIGLKARLTGTTELSTGLEAAAAGGRNQAMADLAPMVPTVADPWRMYAAPMPANQSSRGGDVVNVTSTPTIAANAVNVTVNASGDPKAIASAVGPILQANITGMITSAARDLRKPPMGQR